jgi:hypothetical protein
MVNIQPFYSIKNHIKYKNFYFIGPIKIKNFLLTNGFLYKILYIIL